MSLCLMMIMKILVHQRIDITDVLINIWYGNIYDDHDDYADHYLDNFDEDLQGLRSQPSLSQTPSYLSSPNPQGVPSHLRIIIICFFDHHYVVAFCFFIIDVTKSPFRTIGVTWMGGVSSRHAVCLKPIWSSLSLSQACDHHDNIINHYWSCCSPEPWSSLSLSHDHNHDNVINCHW